MHDHPWDGRTSSIGLAKIRLDGFVSLDPGAEGGLLTRKPLVFSGRQLELNASTKPGSVAVEVRGATGKPIPGYALAECYTFEGDSVHHVVTWKGKDDVGQLAGQVLKLRFDLRNAKLYASQFTGTGPCQ